MVKHGGDELHEIRNTNVLRYRDRFRRWFIAAAGEIPYFDKPISVHPNRRFSAITQHPKIALKELYLSNFRDGFYENCKIEEKNKKQYLIYDKFWMNEKLYGDREKWWKLQKSWELHWADLKKNFKSTPTCWNYFIQNFEIWWLFQNGYFRANHKNCTVHKNVYGRLKKMKKTLLTMENLFCSFSRRFSSIQKISLNNSFDA